MRTLVYFLLSLFIWNQTLAHSPEGYDEWFSESVSRCQVNSDEVPDLTADGLHFGMNAKVLRAVNLATYNSTKRLPEFVHFDNSKDSFVAKLPYDKSGKGLEISGYFLFSIKDQVESALQRGLADYISITDMGVARFYVPLEKWNTIQAEYPNFHQSRSEIYQEIIDGRDTKIFYPTAMMFDLESENKSNHLQWRFVNRNLYTSAYSGSLDVLYNLENRFNTLWQIKGHKMINAAFTISANKNGCFSYNKNGKKYYFDLSFFFVGLSAAEKERLSNGIKW